FAGEHDCIVESKDDITAGDGAKHDIIPNKAVLATTTTCNVFRLLKSAGIPVAFNKQEDECSFSAPLATMVKLEVVARREAHGSYLKRFPHIPKGTIFPKLVFELFLKTSKRKWGEFNALPCDDPHAVFVFNDEDPGPGFLLYDVKKEFTGQKAFHFVPESQVLSDSFHKLKTIEEITRKTFLVLERQWQMLGRRLVDFKIEFGFSTKGELLVADVIDNDSWRLLDEGGHYIDKQAYRDGGTLDDVAEKYRRVAEFTNRFGLPKQRLITWCGSKEDDISPLKKRVDELLGTRSEMSSDPLTQLDNDEITIVEGPIITCSMHKETSNGLRILRELEQECPDSVIIAFIGMSNGAGPTLQGNTMMQVINCSPSVKDFPDDIWSSLRMPSNVPCLTALSPGNAVHAALQILAYRNPALYALLRARMEERFENSILI
ncbi:MAG: phosphoribosylaminoimidazolesuccinocarboxamide synthase, partial [bacterium]|nr:phosphoribosylaminoimidazolesuccinocarboxamide synthase [bacterium]